MGSSTDSKTQSLTQKPFRFFLKENPRAVFLGILFLLLTNGLDAAWPLLLKQGLDLLENKATLSELTRVCLFFIAVMMGLSATRYGWRRFFGEFHTYAAESLRQRIFKHLNQLSARFFQKTSVGEIMSLMTNDVQSFRQAIGPGFLILMDGVIIIAFVFPIMVSLHWSWTWKCLVFLPLIPFLIWKVMHWIHITYKNQQDRFAELTGFCHETVNGIRVIKGYHREQNRLQEFQSLNQKYIQATQKNAFVDSLFSPVMEFGVASGSVILLFISQQDVISGAVSIGTFVAFHRYIQKMVWPMSALGFGLSFFQKGYASFERIKEVLLTESDIKDTGTEVLTHFESLEFRNVTFKYPGCEVPALNQISFELKKGQSLALLGSIGSGKSTLFALLTRTYEPTHGQIFINRKPLATYSLHSLRSLVRLTPQEVFLYSRTVFANLALEGNQQSSPALEKAAQQAQILSDIESLPSQWMTQLGEKGVNLSGGQKQRLTISRTLLGSAELLLFDDVMSAVDTVTEEKMSQSLFESQKSQKTVIVAAHRISTVKSLDFVLVLNHGRLEYFGPQSEASQNPIYSEWVQMQESST